MKHIVPDWRMFPNGNYTIIGLDNGLSAVVYQDIVWTKHGLFKGLIMDGCVLLTSTPECVVSPRRAIPRAAPSGSPRGETTHEGVDVNNTHPSMINPDYNMILANLTLNYQYFAH